MPAFPFGPGFFADWVDWEDWGDSSLSDINERRHRVRRDPYPAADRSHPLRRGGLDIDGRGVNAERGGEPFPHLWNVGSQAGSLGEHGRVHMHYAPTGTGRHGRDAAEQLDAVSPPERRIAGREVRPRSPRPAPPSRASMI